MESNAISSERIALATRMGGVTLRVQDLERSRRFYEESLGLRAFSVSPGSVRLGSGDGETLVELIPCPNAPPRPANSTGLYHLAILVPSRLELSFSLLRSLGRGIRLSGASDHLVSEALYMNDPDGIGIEIYRDRPREEWTHDGQLVRMTLDPLDLDSLVALGRGHGDLPERVSVGTRIGHVHLNVSDLAETTSFYRDVLGFDVTAKLPQANFLAAGGYHHHLGLNTWLGPGAPWPPGDAIGLDRFTIAVPDAAELEAVASRIGTAGLVVSRTDREIGVTDPSGNRIRFVSQAE